MQTKYTIIIITVLLAEAKIILLIFKLTETFTKVDLS